MFQMLQYQAEKNGASNTIGWPEVTGAVAGSGGGGGGEGAMLLLTLCGADCVSRVRVAN